MEPFTNKDIQQDHFKSLSFVKEAVAFSNLNRPYRNQNEDAYFIKEQTESNKKQYGLYCVLDGHGGKDVVDYVKEQLPTFFDKFYQESKETNMEIFLSELFKKIDDQVRSIGASEQGSCCCIAFIKEEANKQKKCFVANLGDTRAVRIQEGQAIKVSKDHKATDQDEQKRIKDGGGLIIRGRVSGQLAVTRALGDFDLKEEGVICTPEVKEFLIDQKTEYLILASDGLWDVCENDKLLQQMGQNFNSSGQNLVEYAIKNGSRDNTTVLVLKFQ